MKTLLAKLSQFTPEATIVILIGGVGLILSGLGTQAQQSASANLNAFGTLQSLASPPVLAHPTLPTVASLVAATPHLIAPLKLPSLPVVSDVSPVLAAKSPAAIGTGTNLVAELSRVEHARELLGKFYNQSVVRSGEKLAGVGRFVRQWTVRALRPAHKKYSKLIADTVLQESERHGFDPVFLMAVIENESSFNPRIIGTVGEIGLMQITPATGEWIAKKFRIHWEGKKSLFDPSINIRIGAAYLAYLREEFDSQGQLYLAAYNMGSLNVNRALERSIRPKDYPMAVMKRYIRFYTDIKTELKGEARPKT